MKIVKLNGNVKFKAPNGYYAPVGYCLQDDNGYIALDNNALVPYSPDGGKAVLNEIIQDGGFVGTIYHISPMV